MEESIKVLKDSSDPSEKALYEEVLKALKEEKAVERKLDALKLKRLTEEKMEKAKAICLESKLHEYREITTVLLEEVASAKDERSMKAIVMDKLNIAARQRPTSSHSYVGGGTKAGDVTSDQFAAMLNKGF